MKVTGIVDIRSEAFTGVKVDKTLLGPSLSPSSDRDSP
jgi:hypothetical protein